MDGKKDIFECALNFTFTILHLPFLCRVQNGFTILYKISPLGGLAPFSVEMTEMSFIFRDPSVRAALPRLLRMTE